MQLPLNGSMDAPPFFYTEYAHDVVTFNGVNYLGVGGEIVLGTYCCHWPERRCAVTA